MDLLQGSVGKTLFLFSFPFMLSTLLQTLYSTTDTIVVGQTLGGAGLSAVSNGSQLMQLVYMLCIGFSSAGQVLIAQAKGAGNQEKMQKVVSTLFLLETAVSVGLGLVCLLFARIFLNLLNTPAEAYHQAWLYIVICCIGIVFTGLYNMFSAVLRGMGDARHPLIFVVIATSLNIVLDILFVAFFKWNVAGAAVATVIGQAVSVLASIWYLARNGEQFGVDFHIRSFRPDRETARQLLKLGIPMSLQGATISISFLFVSSMVNGLGVDGSAAYGVMQKIQSIPSFIAQGFGLGATSMIGQNLGAGRKDRVQKSVLFCILFCAVVYAIFGIFYITVPETCFRLFTQDPAVLAYAVLCMTMLFFELPAKCVMPACNGLVNAQGFVRLSMVVAVLDAFVGRVFLCWFFGNYLAMGAKGFFLGMILGTYVTAIIVFVYFVSGLWRKREALV